MEKSSSSDIGMTAEYTSSDANNDNPTNVELIGCKNYETPAKDFKNPDSADFMEISTGNNFLIEQPHVSTSASIFPDESLKSVEKCLEPDPVPEDNSMIELERAKNNNDLLIKSEILEDDESQDGIEEESSDGKDHENNNSSLQKEISVEDELKKCKRRLDSFGNELKLLCAELEIVTEFISKHFGIKLINKESIQFKHIYDFEEIEQLSAALSLLSEVEKQQGCSGNDNLTPSGRKRGRPGRKSLDTPIKPKPQSTTPSGQKRGRKKKNKENVHIDDLIPQDFLETIYDEKDNDSQNPSRPKRATRKKVNYKEDKELEVTEPVKPKEKESEEEYGEHEEEDCLASMEEKVVDSDFFAEEIEPIKKTKSKRKKATPRKKRSESLQTEPEEEEEMLDEGEEEDSDGQTDENGDDESKGGKKKRVRKRYPKKPGVVWNSSLPKQCDECGKVLKGTSTLKLHKMMHADERPHSCEICGNKFRFRRNLKVHMMAIHAGERNLQCSYCPKAFYAPKDLRIHERTHTGEKPYSCTTCTKSFNVKEHLTMHMRVHTGERPYKCSVCEKAFSQANSLRIHKKIHMRDKEPTPRKPRKPRNPQQTPQNVPPTQQSQNNNLPQIHNNQITTTQQQQLHNHHQSSITSAAALLQQLTPHHSTMSTSNTSSPMPAHINSNLMTTSSSNTVPPINQSSFTSINSAAMNFHQQTHNNNMQHSQNPFIVPLNENWRTPFSTGVVDHQRFGGPSNSSRGLVNRTDNFGTPLSQSQHVTDPRFHSFYSQNQ